MKAILQHTPRASGYVTQRLIDQHGSFRAALAWLNGSDPADRKSNPSPRTGSAGERGMR